MSEQPEIRKGLNGVVADYTEVSKVCLLYTSDAADE